MIGVSTGIQAQIPTPIVARLDPTERNPYGYTLKTNITVEGKVPLVIQLHGASGGDKLATEMNPGENVGLAQSGYSYVFVKPVCPDRWTADKLDLTIESIITDYAAIIDRNRVYIFGHSMGGYGSWLYCLKYGTKIAAMMSSEGGFIGNTGPISNYDFKHFKTLPIWAFHNKDDGTVPIKKAQELIDAVWTVGGIPKFTFYETGKHSDHYNDMMTGEPLDWLFSQSLVERSPGFEQYQVLNFTAAELNNSEVSGAEADADKDGVKNLVEYATGKNPRVATTGAGPVIELKGNQLTLTFRRLKDPVDVTYQPEVSSDLINWNRDLHGMLWVGAEGK